MFFSCWLALGALIPATLSINPGVKVELTRKGLEYGKLCSTRSPFQLKCNDLHRISSLKFDVLLLGRQLGMVSIQRKLKTIKIPDFSGSQSVAPIGKVQYSLSK